MAKSRFARTYIDESKELSTIDFAIREMTAASMATLLPELATLGSAIDALTGGTLRKSQAMQDSSAFSGAAPTDPSAQRERKWRVDFQDTVTGRYGKVEIPIALVDITTKIAGTDQADLTDTKWTDFIAAFETTARSVEGNTVNVVGATLVGRNL